MARPWSVPKGRPSPKQPSGPPPSRRNKWSGPAPVQSDWLAATCSGTEWASDWADWLGGSHWTTDWSQSKSSSSWRSAQTWKSAPFKSSWRGNQSAWRAAEEVPWQNEEPEDEEREDPPLVEPEELEELQDPDEFQPPEAQWTELHEELKEELKEEEDEPDHWLAPGELCPTEPSPSRSTTAPSTTAPSLPVVKRELGDDSSSSESERGQFVAILNKGPPKPKKMPKRRPMPATSVATSKYPPSKRSASEMAPPRAPEAEKQRRLEVPWNKPIIRPSTKADLPRPPSEKRLPAKQPVAPAVAVTGNAPTVLPPPASPPPLVAPLVPFVPPPVAPPLAPPPPPRHPGRPPVLTSTGFRPAPPPMREFRDSRRSPLPGPPPIEDPPFWALEQSRPFVNPTLGLPALPAMPAMPALPAPPLPGSSECLALVPASDALAIPGDGPISIDIDDDAAAVGQVLQQKEIHSQEFLDLLKEFQRRAAVVLQGATEPLCLEVRVGANATAEVSGGLQAPAGYYSNSTTGPSRIPSSLAVERIVDAGDIRFSQRSMKRRFQDGRSLEELIMGLVQGVYNSMTEEFLKLTVVEKKDSAGNPTIYSKDNRRLYCLQEYQRRICNAPVPVRVRILPWQDVVDACKFQRNYDTEMDGHDIVIRN